MSVKTAFLGAALGLFLSALGPIAIAAVDAEDPSAAQSVVDRYFQALSQGDTEALEELLGGRMWERTARRMINPNYSSFLQEQYASAHHSIEETRVLEDEGRVEVIVELSHPGTEPDIYTFVLQRSNEEDPYRIVAEF